MEISMTEEVRLIVLGLAALAGFGVLYNSVVARMERQGADQGYTAFLVVAGVAVTIVVYALMVWDVRATLLLLLCFVASGVPMIVGSVQRYNHQRRTIEERKADECREVLGE